MISRFPLSSPSTCTCRLPWLHILHVQEKIKTNNSFKYTQTVSFLQGRKVSGSLTKSNLYLKVQESEVKQRDVILRSAKTLWSLPSLSAHWSMG